jgi:hypothetical protein
MTMHAHATFVVPSQRIRSQCQTPRGKRTKQSPATSCTSSARICALDRVEGPQSLPGESTDHDVDGKAVCEGGEGFLIVECKRHSNRVKKGTLCDLAYRIRDTGAAGGIIVTPLDLQAGAKLVANHNDVVHVKLDPYSTTESYFASFLERVFIGLHSDVPAPESRVDADAGHVIPAADKRGIEPDRR